MANVSSSNSQKALVPKLRFPGFEGDYILTHIGDVFSERAERGGAAMELLSVTMNDGVVKRSQIEGKDNSSEDKSNYKIVRSGDLVYNSMRMWQGANGISKYDGIVSPAYTVLKAVEEIDEGYFAALFKTVKLINEFRKNSQGLTSDTWNLKYPQIAGIRICVPKLSEQHKISSFLRLLDKRIDAQRRLVEALKSYKRGALSKLFPKEGASAPEYRFAGFSGDWEERKLGEIVDVRSGRDYKHLSEGSIPVYGTGGYMLSVNEALSYDEDAIGIGRKGTIDKPYVLKAPFWTVDTLFYAVPSKNVDLDFAFCIFQNVDWKKKDESTGVPSLSKTAINSIDVITPPFKEQQEIGSFFHSLDDLITLQQQEVSIAQKIKSGLLNGLFI